MGAVTSLTGGRPLHRLRALLSTDSGAAESTHDASADEPLPSSCRFLFETTPDPVLIADAESGTLLAVNDATVDLLGHSSEALRGESITQLHPAGAERSYRRLFEQHVASAEDEPVTVSRLPNGEQIYVETRAGERVPVEINARVFETEAGTVVTGVFRDITDRRRRERELETFKAAVENAGHSIYWTDRDGTIEYVNPAFEELTGYSSEEAVGRNPRLLQSGVHDSAFYRDTWETILDGETWEGEIVNERTDGEQFTIDQTIAPVESEDGQVERFVAINSDITERRDRERELQEFKRAVEHVGLAVFITDADGTIEYVNPAFERITGYQAAAAIGRTPSILHSGEKDPEYYRELWETIRSGETWEEEIVNRRADDTTYHALQTISPIVDADDTPRKFVAIQRDVSDIKAFEAELERQNERLERFASVVSHDLRNPLTVAQGRLELARGEHDSDHLQAVDSSLDRMETLIADLLALAREKDGSPTLEAVDLSTIVEESWRTVDTAAATIRVTTDQTIRAAPGRVRQALENLFRNAVEHGGERLVVTVGDLDDGFYIEDDGSGIPVSERGNVLQSGYSTAGGTGLGLSIVERCAEAHDWEITVTAGKDGGARFEFTGVEFG
ncbi:PAS domain-containing sensor histidine kinase [Halanaeroarchaeum sp. HSR-CO]|uniref:PAS domain-containing protein n=1 Tax=Halanaeroarchaeum sp. HSR-CO TaxID=2866382 RepID=UPI00217E0152|nr:PAS domain-containing sensor histidine kinase [Halanaeroarchaeum sp. HSR-CO]